MNILTALKPKEKKKEIEIEEALSSSLFEGFLDKCPEESKVQLNYQFRMNPDIGNYISTLFTAENLTTAQVRKI